MLLTLIQLPWIVVLSYIIAKGCGLSVELPSSRGSGFIASFNLACPICKALRVIMISDEGRRHTRKKREKTYRTIGLLRRLRYISFPQILDPSALLWMFGRVFRCVFCYQSQTEPGRIRVWALGFRISALFSALELLEILAGDF